jgi:hypothetical protein
VADTPDNAIELTEEQVRRAARPRGLDLKVKQVAEEAVKLYRARDQLINQPEKHAELAYVTGCNAGLRIALCVLQGWDPAEEADKEGKADELVLAVWQSLHPEDWAGTNRAPEHAHEWMTLASWPSGPDGETDRLIQCKRGTCGLTVTRAHDEDDDGLTQVERAIRDAADAQVKDLELDTEGLLEEVKRRARGE